MFFFKKKKATQRKEDVPDVNISSVNFIVHGLTVGLVASNIHKQPSTTYHLVIKNMADSTTVHTVTVPLSAHSQEEVMVSIPLEDMPFLQEAGKWSLHIEWDDTKVRLSPTKELKKNIGYASKSYAHHCLTEAYITVNGNLSLKTTKVTNEKGFHPQLTAFRMDMDKVTLSGTITLPPEAEKQLILLIQKRKSPLTYTVPVLVEDDDTWIARMEVPHDLFEKGTWDYYIQVNQTKKARMKVEKEVLSPDASLIYHLGNETVEAVPYITAHGSLSVRHQTARVCLSRVIGQIIDGTNVSVSGTVEKSGFLAHADLASSQMIVYDGESGNRYEMKTVLSAEKGEVIAFTFDMDYASLQAEGTLHERMKWDVYLQASIGGTDYYFRLITDDVSIMEATLYQTSSPVMRHLYFYPTINNQLSIAYREPAIARDVSESYYEEGNLVLKGRASISLLELRDDEVLHRDVLVKRKYADDEVRMPLSRISRADLAEGDVGFQVRIPLAAIFAMHDQIQETYDILIQVHYKDFSKVRKLGCEEFTYKADDHLIKNRQTLDDVCYFNYLLLTPGGNLKLEAYRYSLEKGHYITKGQVDDRHARDQQDVWLVGERPHTAQDTGYHFFKYCRKQHPDLAIYYVIDQDSPDIRNLGGLGNVLYFGSMEHMRIAAVASTFICSHDVEYILPTRGVDWPSYQNGKRVFLQHGVLGRKKVDYDRDLYQFPYHMFCVSSEAEFNLVVHKMGYDEDAVKITGLSRFDALGIGDAAKDESIIAIMPTWRDWIKSESEFLDSAYFHHYKELLIDSRLLDVLASSGTRILFYPHYRMQPYVSHFKALESQQVAVVEHGEMDVQRILKACNMLITDYSSVSFDVNYMRKPVIFYHFDFGSFFKKGLLRPKEETFLGEIVMTNEQAVDAIWTSILEDFQEKTSTRKRIEQNFKYIDTENNKRIFAEISRLS